MSDTTEEKKRIYNTEYRKKLTSKIKLLNTKQDYLKLFKIIKKDPNNNYSENNNGIWINLNILEDNTIKKVKKFLEKTLDLTSSTDNYKYEYKPYIENDIENDIGPKLSNHEKSLIKRINLSEPDI